MKGRRQASNHAEVYYTARLPNKRSGGPFGRMYAGTDEAPGTQHFGAWTHRASAPLGRRLDSRLVCTYTSTYACPNHGSRQCQPATRADGGQDTKRESVSKGGER